MNEFYSHQIYRFIYRIEEIIGANGWKLDNTKCNQVIKKNLLY